MERASRLEHMESSGIREVFHRASELDNPINLSIGQPSFDVPDVITEAANQAMKQGKNRYTVTRGLPELRSSLHRHIEERTGITPPSVLVTAGVSGGLVLSLLCVVDPGDHLLVPDPYFVSYEQLPLALEANLEYVDTYPDFRLTPEKLDAAITDDTRVLLFNNPVNPTGVSYDADEIAALADVCRDRDLLVISDEIYADFTYDGSHCSMLSEAPERTILLNGCSKTYGIPGWRIGWVAGPEPLIDDMATMQQYSFVCAHTPSQHACIKALEVDMTSEIRAYREKRDRLYRELKDHYEIVRPDGAFYMFPEVPGDVDDETFVDAALERNLMIVPGNVFSHHSSHFRISYAVDDEELTRGIDHLKSLARDVRANG